MPQTWKKLVVSGSEAQFNSVFVTTSITASSVSSSFTGSFSGDGAGLTGLGTSLSIDTYKFVGNGSTTNYILSSSYSAVSLLISVAGISYTEGLDYTLSGSTLAFSTAPPSSSNILIKGLLNNSNATGSFTGSFIGDGRGLTNINAALSIDTYTFNGTGATTAYVLSQSYSANSLVVSVAGLSQTNITDYTVSTNTLTFVNTPPSASNILIRAFVDVSSNATGSFTGSFIGNGAGLINVNAAVALDTYLFTGSGATTNYVLSQSYTQNNTFVTLDGLTAIAGDDFTISGATLTFTPAPISQSIIAVRAFANIGIGTGSFSGSFAGTASAAISASYAPAPAGTVSSSAQITTLLPASIVSSSTQFQTLANPFTGSFTGSHTGTFPYASLTSIPGGIVSASAQINILSGISASYATTASAATSITFTPTTASFATTASAATSITFTPTTASFATTASYANNYAVGKAIAFSLIF